MVMDCQDICAINVGIPRRSKESDLVAMAENLLYLGPKCHGGELRLEWPMGGRDSDRGS
jgi:hypothetical protein